MDEQSEPDRLRTLERALSGVERSNDLPGSFAPAAWFDFLAGRAHRLEGIFRHNLDDVLSLVTLVAHLGCVLREIRTDGQELTGCRATRAEHLARAFAQAGEHEAALRWIDTALERCSDAPQRERAAQVLRAQVCSALGARDEAFELLMNLCTIEDHLTAACLLAAARLALRVRHEFDLALQLCLRARSVIERQHTSSDRARLTRQLDALMLRLERGPFERFEVSHRKRLVRPTGLAVLDADAVATEGVVR